LLFADSFYSHFITLIFILNQSNKH
jgi:hypothetical protein